MKTDKATGGSLGICWIKFADHKPRNSEVSTSALEKFERERRKGTAQDGHQVALEAVLKGSGQKIGPRMMMLQEGVMVVMDGDGRKCSAAIKEELLKRNPPRPLPSVPVLSPALPPPSPTLPSRPAFTPALPSLLPDHSSTNRRNDFDLPSSTRFPPSAPRLASILPSSTSIPSLPQRPSAASSVPAFYGGRREQVPSVRLAVAVAIDEANKRRDVKRKNEAVVDMDMDSSNDGSSESEVEEKVFFHGGASSARDAPIRYPRNLTGPPPAAAIAWQASPMILLEKLKANRNAYLTILRATFTADRTGKSSSPAHGLNAGDLARFFNGYELDRVSC